MGIPELTSQEAEELCTIAESAARKSILSRVHQKRIERLNVSAEVEGTRPVSLDITVEVDLSSAIENVNVQELANEAVKEGFKSAEKYLRELGCHSKK